MRTTLAFNGLMKLQVATLLKKETLVHMFYGDFCKNFNTSTLFYRTLPGDCFCFIPIQNFFPLTITLSEWKKTLMFQVVNDWLNWRFFLDPGNCGISTDLQLERCFGDKKKWNRWIFILFVYSIWEQYVIFWLVHITPRGYVFILIGRNIFLCSSVRSF